MQAENGAGQRTLDYGVNINAGSELALGSHTLEEADSIAFARAWDPQAMHINREAAEAGAYGGLIASGVQTIGIYQRLAVRAVFSHWAVIADRGLRDVRFLYPVRPGDTLRGTMRIETVHFDVRGRALVDTIGTLDNQRGERVLRLNMEVYVHAQPALR